MSRGGFGGGPRSTGGLMRGQPLPFEVDPDLEKDITGYDVEASKKNGEEDPRQALFPPYPGGIPRAPPVTTHERRLVNIHRMLIAQKHAGPFYTGPKGSIKAVCGTKRSAAEFDPFEDQPTYAKKYQKTEFRLPDIRKHKFAAPHLLPKELWPTIGYNPKGEVEGAPKKKLILSKKSGLDKLARFDEDAEEKGAGGADDDDDAAKGDDEDAEEPDGPEDDDFEEDEDDDNDDYNAEQYFDDGEEDFEEAGGDEYGADDGI